MLRQRATIAFVLYVGFYLQVDESSCFLAPSGRVETTAWISSWQLSRQDSVSRQIYGSPAQFFSSFHHHACCYSRLSKQTKFTATIANGLRTMEDNLQDGMLDWMSGALRKSDSSQPLSNPVEIENYSQEANQQYELIPSPDGIKRQEVREADKGFCSIRRYNPDSLRPDTPFEYAQSFLRMLQVLGVVSSMAAKVVIAEWGSSGADVKDTAAYLRLSLISLGPTFVKVGQVLANRPDIIRADYMEELTKLQDKIRKEQVPPFSSVTAFEMMEQGLGRPVEEVFSTITPEPIAAASLGQVYRARLRESGAEVAVKVQRPTAGPMIKRDLHLLRLLLKGLNRVAVRRLGTDAVTLLDEFAENLLLELDYRQEARNILDFQRNFKDDPTVKIPDVYMDLTSEKVLVMEWIEGVRCTDMDRLHSLNIPIGDFIRVGVQAGMRQLLEFGLFHGDPHPGNVFAMADGRIAYVDFGSVAEISDANKEALMDAVVHAMDEDFDEIAVDLSRLGFLAEGVETRPVAVALGRMWKDAVGRSISDFNFRTVTAQFSKLAYTYPIRVPERFALVIRTLLTQEGICMTLDPNFRLLTVAYPYVAKRLLRDPLYTSRLPQVLLKKVPEARKPVFDFRRLYTLLSLAVGVAGSGPLALLSLIGTAADAVGLAFRRPAIALVLARGVVRWAGTKATILARWAGVTAGALPLRVGEAGRLGPESAAAAVTKPIIARPPGRWRAAGTII